MNVRKLATRSLTILAVCTLLPVMTGSLKGRVERPLMIRGQSQQVWYTDENGIPSWPKSAEGSGVATHFGSVTFGMTSWTIIDYRIWVEGTLTSESMGDHISWEGFLDEPSCRITGGTGRFSGASGEFTFTSMTVRDTIFDPVGLTMTIKLIWTAWGTITY